MSVQLSSYLENRKTTAVLKKSEQVTFKTIQNIYKRLL